MIKRDVALMQVLWKLIMNLTGPLLFSVILFNRPMMAS